MATVRAEVTAVAEVVVADADRWVAAYKTWQAAAALATSSGRTDKSLTAD